MPPKPKAQRRPDEQGNGRIQERRRRVRSRRQMIEGEPSDASDASGKEAGFQDARRGGC
jgi:hypothetical protein